MIRYLIDTNVVIQALSGRFPILARRMMACRRGEIGLSAIVLHELYFGAFASQKVQHNLDTLQSFSRDIPLLPFEADDARHAGDIRAVLKAGGAPIGPLDVLIAGQARARGLILVSGNVREFSRVPGLDVVDWSQ